MAHPTLILLNGIPGSGKSTLARAWADRRAGALAMALDVDVLRGMLGRWSDDPLEAGLAARAVAVAAIDVHLRAGHDVIVPQYLRRAGFIDELDRTAHRAGARFVECAILVDAATAIARLEARAAAPQGAGPEGRLEESIDAVHEDFERFLATRTDAVALTAGTVEELDAAIAASGLAG